MDFSCHCRQFKWMLVMQALNWVQIKIKVCIQTNWPIRQELPGSKLITRLKIIFALSEIRVVLLLVSQ